MFLFQLVEPNTFVLGEKAIRVHYKAMLTGAVTSATITDSVAKVLWSSSPSGILFIFLILFVILQILISIKIDGRNRSASHATGVLIASPNITFVVNSSSLPETLGDRAAVGETMHLTFSIRLPHGFTNNSIVQVDVEKSGLLKIVGAKVSVVPPNIKCAFAQGDAITAVDSNGDGARDTVLFNLGDIHNTPDGISQNMDDNLVLEVTALVVASENNTNGQVLSATSQLTYTGSTLNTISSPEIYIYVTEPQIVVQKEPVPQRDLQAGDVVLYTLTIAHTSNSTAPAYDTMVTDNLSPLLELVVGSVIPPPGGNVLVGNNEGEKTISVWVPPFSNYDAPVIITYNATISSSVRTGDALPNIVNIAYNSSSLSQHNIRDRRRYTATNFTTVYTPAPILAFTMNSSNLETPDNIVTIGEVISFISNITMPHGTISNATLRVWLPVSPASLEMLHARVILMDASVIAITNTSVVEGLIINGGNDTNNDTIPDSAFFDFGTILNTPDEVRYGPNDRIVVEVMAIVRNIPENVENVMFTTYSEFVYMMDEPVYQTVSISNIVTEPLVTINSKTWSDHELLVAGDIITFNVTLDHASTSTAPAFDLWIFNKFPISLTYLEAHATQGEVVLKEGYMAIHVRAFMLNSGPINVTYKATVSKYSPVSSWVYTWTNISYSSSLVYGNNSDNIRTRGDGARAFYTTPDPYALYHFFNFYFYFFFYFISLKQKLF